MKWVVAVLPLSLGACKNEAASGNATREEIVETQEEYLVGTHFKYDLSERLGERMEDHKGIRSLLQKAGLELGEGTGVTLAGDKLYMSATSGDHHKMAELMAGLNRKEGKWLPVNTSGIAFSKVFVFHGREGWMVGDRRMTDTSEVIQAVGSSDEPLMIVIGKSSSLGDEDLLTLAAKLSRSGKRRVFYHQAKGSIDLMHSGFEFTR